MTGTRSRDPGPSVPGTQLWSPGLGGHSVKGGCVGSFFLGEGIWCGVVSHLGMVREVFRTLRAAADVPGMQEISVDKGTER